MDDKNTQDQPAMSSNDELAKTLSGGLQFDELPAPGDDTSSKSSDDSSASDDTSADDASKDDAVTTGFADDTPSDDTPPSISTLPKPVGDSASDDSSASDDASSSSSGNSDLDKLKSSALDDLRPLVGKLNLSPEEKFDTLLLIIRSTDDQALLAEAHAAAKEISDDAKRAQALLDVIKEVDYFSKK